MEDIVERALRAEGSDPESLDDDPEVVCIGCGDLGFEHAVHCNRSRTDVRVAAFSTGPSPPPNSSLDWVDVGDYVSESVDGDTVRIPTESAANALRTALRDRLGDPDLVLLTGSCADLVANSLLTLFTDAVGEGSVPYLVTLVEFPRGAGMKQRQAGVVAGLSDLLIPVAPRDVGPVTGPGGLAGPLARDVVESLLPPTASEIALADFRVLGAGTLGHLSTLSLPPDLSPSGIGDRLDEVPGIDPDEVDGFLAYCCVPPDVPREQLDAIAERLVAARPTVDVAMWDYRRAARYRRQPHVKLIETSRQPTEEREYRLQAR